jgi:hypothetical protein
MRAQFDNWEDFEEEVDAFTHKRFQLFKKRTSTSILDRNSKIQNVSKRLPERFGTYAVTLKCVHGMTRKAKDQKKTQKSTPRQRKRAKTKSSVKKTKRKLKTTVQKQRFSRYIGCTATINATVQRVRPPTPNPDGSVDDDGCAIRWKSKGGHNHPTTSQLFAYYPEIRLPKTEAMFDDVERLVGCGGNATGICLTYRRETGEYRICLWALINGLTQS